MSVGVAIIGCGAIGRKRRDALPDGMHLRSVYDPDHSAAASLASSGGDDVVVAATAQDAISTDGVALVIVATPHHLLADTATLAVDAGRDVLVEKPGAAALGPLEELKTRADSNDRLVRVGFNHRFHPAMLKTREVLATGGHGRILNIRARYGHGGRPGYEKEWRADRAISGGGELVDQGIHLIDLTRFLAGDVDLAFAELRTDFWPMSVEDNAFLALRTRAGAFAWLHASWTEWKNLFSLEVALERAKVEVEGLGGSYGTEVARLHEMLPEMGPPVTSAWEWPRADPSWAAELVDVLCALEGAPSIGATVDDAIEAFRVIEAAYAR